MAPLTKSKILICDDDALFRKTVALLLKDLAEITFTLNGDEAITLLSKKAFDLLLLDVQIRTHNEGLETLEKATQLYPELPIVMLTGRKDFQSVQRAIRHGARDYLSKDFEPAEFRLAVERILKSQKTERQLHSHTREILEEENRYQITGNHPSIQKVRHWIEKFRSSHANVLITGETGTGKENIAHLLRKRDPSGNPEPFVPIDSSTLHSNTAESILFGHEKGAFTGADQKRIGLFEAANGGVVFFDEIANMPLEIQNKLLRVLQEKEITRLGSHRQIQLDFRVIAATNRSLEDCVRQGKFLEDLYQRLNVLPIQAPPLRDRITDLPDLVTSLLQSKGRADVKLSEDALRALSHYPWPGNVRELSAMLEYSLAMTEGEGSIEINDLHPKLLSLPQPGTGANSSSGGKSFYDQVAHYEIQLLQKEYAASEGNISQMAIRLKMDRSHLHTKLTQYQIHKPHGKKS